MKYFLMLSVLLAGSIFAADAVAQRADGILATSTGKTYTESSLSPDGQKLYAEQRKVLAETRSNLLSEMIVTTLLDAEPAVTYYVIGDTSDPNAPGNEWRTADQWPPVKAKDTKFYFHRDRTLSHEKPVEAGPLIYRYDPSNPVPTIGGIQLSIPAGPMDQQKIESRNDVLVFTSETLNSPVEVTGRVRAKIWFAADVPDTDFIARLCDVYPDGRSFNLCEGAIRARFREGLDKEKPLKDGEIHSQEIDLWSTSVIYNAGHRIRVHVTSSSSPGYDPNPNTGAAFRSNNESRKANIKLYLDPKRPSHITLPIATAGR